MIRVHTAKRKPRFFRGGHEFSQQVRTLTEPDDNLPEGVEPDLTKDQAKAIRSEQRFLEVEDVPADEAKKILASLEPAPPKNPKKTANDKAAGNKGNGGKSAGNSSAAGKGDDPASKGAGESSGKSSGKKGGAGKVNVNTASAEELAAVSGIGEEIAKAIVQRRDKQPFKALPELEVVSGLGEAKVKKLADRLTV
jgi:competence ComEA-like helix-hairpin-helix protein